VLSLDGTPHGITVNSFTSVSLAPPLVLVCVDHRSQVIEHFREGEHFGINVLCEHQQELSQRFARSGPDRFRDVQWYSGKTGVPLLPDVLATFECRLVDSRPAGDHLILIGEVLHVAFVEGKPLAYFGSSYRSLMHELLPQPTARAADSCLDSPSIRRAATSSQ
jgi:flavin reductase (DIM6/NTAB) family NADH-FMN oxidoreductase RutF